MTEIKVLGHVTPQKSLSTGEADGRAMDAVNVAMELHAVHTTIETQKETKEQQRKQEYLR